MPEERSPQKVAIRSFSHQDPGTRQTPETAFAGTGLKRFFLFTKEAAPDAPTPVAYAQSTLNALEALVPEPNAMAPLWGDTFHHVSGAGGVDAREVVDPAALRVVTVTSDDGGHHAIAACPETEERLLMREAWQSLGILEARMVKDLWRLLDHRHPPRRVRS